MSNLKRAIEVIHMGDSTIRYRRLIVQWTRKRQLFFERKYLIERPIGMVLLFVSSPLILLLWMLVKISSRGPGFYRQTRVGLNGKNFEVFKLRSMRHDAERHGQAVWCAQRDSRITWMGKILRTLHLDELPQLLNVARGEMSLVGPRPERPIICKELEQEIEAYSDRVLVKPGITGLSQINLPPDTTLADVRRKQILDLHYINETNLFLELRILIATALRIVGIKGQSAMKMMFLCRRSLLKEKGVLAEPKKWVPRSSHRRQPVSQPTQSNSITKLVFDSDNEIDLDMDCDSCDSSSGIGLDLVS